MSAEDEAPPPADYTIEIMVHHPYRPGDIVEWSNKTDTQDTRTYTVTGVTLQPNEAIFQTEDSQRTVDELHEFIETLLMFVSTAETTGDICAADLKTTDGVTIAGRDMRISFEKFDCRGCAFETATEDDALQHLRDERHTLSLVFGDSHNHANSHSENRQDQEKTAEVEAKHGLQGTNT